MGGLCTVSKTSRLFIAPNERVPLELCNGAWAKKTRIRGYLADKKFDILSRLDTTQECDRDTTQQLVPLRCNKIYNVLYIDILHTSFSSGKQQNIRCKSR